MAWLPYQGAPNIKMYGAVILKTFLGGAGNKVLRVIEGDAHAYVFASPGTKKWDTCAPEAILVAMGGLLTGIFLEIS